MAQGNSEPRHACDAPPVGPDTLLRDWRPRIALLTPYGGENLGDAAIQDAIIANLRLRLLGAEFSGICLNCDNFTARHGRIAFPLCVTSKAFYGMSVGQVGTHTNNDHSSVARTNIKTWLKNNTSLRAVLCTLRATVNWIVVAAREICHCVDGYRFLRTQDILIVSGGGQLDEEWGGPWGHPFALFKWAVLARLARIPYAMASVGAGKMKTTTARFFITEALRSARYRSYRDEHTKEIVASVLPIAAQDSVVPDLAFSLPSADLPPAAGIRAMSNGRKIVAISPIAYAKTGSWPHHDPALYDRYLEVMATAIAELVDKGYFLLFVWSSLGDDQAVIPELVARLSKKSDDQSSYQTHVATISTWRDLVSSLLDADILVASRLHSVILALVLQKPTVAISFDPKVDWIMEDIGHSDYRLDIHDVTPTEILSAIRRVEQNGHNSINQITSYTKRTASVSDKQYDTLADLFRTNRRPRIGKRRG